MPPIGPKSDSFLQKIVNSRIAIVTDGEHSDIDKISSLFTGIGENKSNILILDSAVTGPSKSQNKSQIESISAGRYKFPMVFVKGDLVGNYDQLESLKERRALEEWLQPHQYDLVVLGGGSGGLAAAKEAAELGKKVALLDFVKPSPIGTSWGLGGTCVNVGCIPKKLFHFTGLLGHSLQHDVKHFGWQLESTPAHKWETLTQSVKNHISSLNWGYRVQLREKNVTYMNSYGQFVGSHKIKAVNKKGKIEEITADRFLVATGTRPRYPGVEGDKECCITSDDLFTLSKPPGRTLLIGASYVSLECAGFLRSLGYDVTVMVRSILLRGFDQDMADRIGAEMESDGVKFLRKHVPLGFSKTSDGQVEVVAKNLESGEAVKDVFDTVVSAIGRDPTMGDMGLDNVGVSLNEKSKKIYAMNEQSTIPYIYAVGDVLDGRPELTPVAIQAGKLLMRRFYAGSDILCEYDNIPTTVFTPLEYGSCGLSEDGAIEKYGEENIEIYHNGILPLEMTPQGRREKEHCYAKMICDSKDNMRVLGLHILSPNAGEITQGFAIALKMGATKADFDRLIGIHPTVAEVFTTLKITKREQSKVVVTGC